MQPGDVLLAVNGTPVKSVEQVRAVVAKSDKSVALLIQRDDEQDLRAGAHRLRSAVSRRRKPARCAGFFFGRAAAAGSNIRRR